MSTCPNAASSKPGRPAGFCAKAATPSTSRIPPLLKRAIRTLWIALDVLDRMWIPVVERLAAERTALRRAAGAEQGGNDGEARRGPGQDLAAKLRHPAAAARARRSAASVERRRGTRICRQRVLPLTESLKDTVARVLPYWHETIAPSIQARTSSVIIAAHGNSLRALVKYLDDISESAIVELNIPTGIPLVYELDGASETAPALLSGRSRRRRRSGGARGESGPRLDRD